MALHPELPGDRQSRRPAADDGNFPTGGRRRRRDDRLEAGPAEKRHIDRWKIGLLTGATLHAEIGAEVAADGGREGGVRKRQIHGLLHLSITDQLPPPLNGDSRRAMGLARGEVFFIFPKRDKATQPARCNHRYATALLNRQIANHAACSQFPVPDLLVKTVDVPARRTGLFMGLSGCKNLPRAAVRHQLGKQNRPADRIQIFNHVRRQPTPLIIIGNGQPRVLPAESLVGSAEENLAPDHPDAGVVTEDVIQLLRSMSADHRDTAGHELGEGIADTPQNPELRGFETGVVLRHRHPARPDIPCDIDLPLGHRVAHAVGGIAADGDSGARIEPSHIVGGGSYDIDHGVREAHRADPLSRCPQNPDGDGLIPSPPEASAEAVLALGNDIDIPVSIGEGLLDTLLKNTRIYPDALFGPGNDDGLSLRHEISLVSSTTHTGCRGVPPHRDRKFRVHRTSRSAAMWNDRAAPQSSSIPYQN